MMSKTYLLRLYVSLGGGVNRCWSIVGICSRISFVMSCQGEPGPNANGCGVDARNGVARRVMDLMCALIIACVKHVDRYEGESRQV